MTPGMEQQPDYLYRLARSGSVEDRTHLTTVMANLLSSPINEGERTLATDILMRLLQNAETDLRRGMAMILAAEPACPRLLIDYLVYENDFTIAEPVILHSLALNDDDLIEIAKKFDSIPYWHAIARRKKISGDLCRFLIGTDDLETYVLLLKNPGSSLCTIATDWLVKVAPNVPNMHESLLMRPEITREQATLLYWSVAEPLQKKILSKFDVDKAMLDKALEITLRHKNHQKEVVTISADMLDLSLKLKQERKINSKQIVDALRRGDMSFFACLWAAHFQLEAQDVLQKLRNDFVSTLAILVKAMRMTKGDYNTLYLLWRRMDHSKAIMQMDDLDKALHQFDQITTDNALKQIQTWTHPPSTTLH